MSSALLIATLQTADTLVMLQVRDRLGAAGAIADVVMASVFALILLALALLLLQLRGIHGTVRQLTGRLEERLDPMFDRGREVAANVEFITGAVRTDVQRVSDAVRSLSERLQSASDRMEERIEEFNALMEVVQSEAEDLFIGSAATMHGVRAGARSLRDGGAPEEPGTQGQSGDKTESAALPEVGARSASEPAPEGSRAETGDETAEESVPRSSRV